MTDDLEGLRAELERLRADQAALALERARLYEREQQARRRMEILARVSRRFAETTLDLGVVDRIATEIGQVMSASVEIAIDRVIEAASDVAVLPLRAHGRILGSLSATRSVEHLPFTCEERQLLEELVDRAAIAIENSRLYRDNQQARSRAEQLFAFAHAVATADRLEQVFDAALDSLQRAVGARRTAILTSDGDGAMHFRAWRGLSSAYRHAAEDRLPWPRHATTFRPIAIRDVASDPLAQADHALYRGEAIGSLAFFPLLVLGRVVGKVSVYFDEPHELTAHDVDLASSIANHLASVIHRYETLAKLEESVRYGELFAGILAHDLRNPLNTVITAAHMIARRHETLGDSLAQPLALVTRSCERMSRMIDQMLDFSRARSGGGIQIQRRNADLAEICGRALAEIHALFPARNVKLDARGNCGGNWDSVRLEQICASLIANAVQHGKASAVGVELDGTSTDAVALRVHNEGAIPPAILPTVFDAFSSAERRREHSRGIGLGLFIVREVVAAHGGTVHVTSSSDQGTTFSLSLPRG